MAASKRYRAYGEKVLISEGALVQQVNPFTVLSGGFLIRFGGASTGKNYAGGTLGALWAVGSREHPGALVRMADPQPENALFIARLEDVGRLIARSERR